MNNFLPIAAICFVGLGFAVWVIGMLLPRQVTASRTTELKASQARIFETVTNIEKQTEWRKDITSVTVHPSGKSWTEKTTAGIFIDFEVRHKEPNSRFEIEFAFKQGFSGYWVGVFLPSSNGTMVQITETIEIKSRIFRVISRIFGFTEKFIDTYLTQLKEAVENQSDIATSDDGDARGDRSRV